MGGGGEAFNGSTRTSARLHHGPLPAPRVQNVNVVEPLPVLGSPEHKDAAGVGVVDRGVADPGLRRGALRQSLRRDPGEVLCRHGKESSEAERGRGGGCAEGGAPTCAQLPNGVFAEPHPGPLTADQDGCPSVDGTQGLTPAAGRATQRRCGGLQRACEETRITFIPIILISYSNPTSC